MSSEILSNSSRLRDRPVRNKRLQSEIDSISITILFIASITHHQAEYRYNGGLYLKSTATPKTFAGFQL